eukprot:3239327-Rhodomonas_salina.1
MILKSHDRHGHGDTRLCSSCELQALQNAQLWFLDTRVPCLLALAANSSCTSTSSSSTCMSLRSDERLLVCWSWPNALEELGLKHP